MRNLNRKGKDVNLFGGKTIVVDDPKLRKYLRIKHEKFKIGEGIVLPKELIKIRKKILGD